MGNEVFRFSYTDHTSPSLGFRKEGLGTLPAW